MSTELRRILIDIDQAAHGLAFSATLDAYERQGGVIDSQVDHRRLIADLGIRDAARVAKSFVAMRNDMRRLYGLNPVKALQHLELLQHGIRRQWFRRLGGPA